MPIHVRNRSILILSLIISITSSSVYTMRVILLWNIFNNIFIFLSVISSVIRKIIHLKNFIFQIRRSVHTAVRRLPGTIIRILRSLWSFLPSRILYCNNSLNYYSKIFIFVNRKGMTNASKRAISHFLPSIPRICVYFMYILLPWCFRSGCLSVQKHL